MAEKRLTFTYYNVKIQALLFKPPIFSEIVVSEKNEDILL